MPSSLLTDWTQRRSLTSLSLADEHVCRAEPLTTDSRRRRRLTTGGRRPRSGVAAEAIQRDVHRLTTTDGDMQRARARVGADRVADQVTGSGRGGTGDVGGSAGVIQLQRRIADGRRRVYDLRP